MNYKNVAQSILDNVGGPDNVKDATHCFTRLRLVLRNDDLADKAAVERLEGVIQVVESGGQFQIVLGGKVNKVYDEFLQLVNVEGGEETGIEGDKGSIGNTILQTISKIFGTLLYGVSRTGAPMLTSRVQTR